MKIASRLAFAVLLASAILGAPRFCAAWTTDKLLTWTHSTESSFAFVSAADMDRCIQIAGSGDDSATKAFWAQKVQSGTATLIPAGTKIYVEDIAHFSGRARVRLEGSSISLWILKSALE